MPIIRTEYLPSGDYKFLLWTNNFLSHLTPLLDVLAFPPAQLELLQALRATFAAALDAVEDPSTRTKSKVKAKNDARKALEQTLRQNVKLYVAYNPVLTNEQRELLGVPVYDKTRTPIPTPTTVPEFRIDWKGVGELKIIFKDAGAESKGRPYGINGAVLIYDVLPEPPVGPSALTRSVLVTRSPYVLKFPEEEGGRRAYITLCWQNNKGQKGPWAMIQAATIP
jgi:hypothetical protein